MQLRQLFAGFFFLQAMQMFYDDFTAISGSYIMEIVVHGSFWSFKRYGRIEDLKCWIPNVEQHKKVEICFSRVNFDPICDIKKFF